jgi:hypothetical protein
VTGSCFVLPAGVVLVLVALDAQGLGIGQAGGPPWECGVMWSMCLMGAPHQGVRQISSRVATYLARLLGNVRRLESMPTRCPVPGVV